MCSGYSGPSGQGFMGFIRDATKGKTGGVGGGVSTGGSSGPSAAAAAATQYLRKRNTAPHLDDMFGVKQ